MDKWTELVAGLVILVGVILFVWFSANWGAFWDFRHAAWEFLKGGVVWAIALIGLVLIVLGINELRD